MQGRRDDSSKVLCARKTAKLVDNSLLNNRPQQVWKCMNQVEANVQ